MKPTPQERAWQHLTAAARQAPDTRDCAAPYGFATRVVAQAFAAPKNTLALAFQRLSWQALGLSCLLALACLLSTYAFRPAPVVLDEDGELRDPIAEVIELGS